MPLPFAVTRLEVTTFLHIVTFEEMKTILKAIGRDMIKHVVIAVIANTKPFQESLNANENKI